MGKPVSEWRFGSQAKGQRTDSGCQLISSVGVSCSLFTLCYKSAIQRFACFSAACIQNQGVALLSNIAPPCSQQNSHKADGAWLMSKVRPARSSGMANKIFPGPDRGRHHSFIRYFRKTIPIHTKRLKEAIGFQISHLRNRKASPNATKLTNQAVSKDIPTSQKQL